MASEIVLSLIVIAGLVVLIFLGLEVAWAIGIAAALVLLFIVHQPIDQFGWSSWDSSYSFTLTAIPLFIFMGAILAESGISEQLFAAAEKWLGHLPGGLACATLGACGIFAAMSGSSMAAAATFSKVAFPPMDKRGYSPSLALGTIAVGSALAPLIPPSILLVIYGGWVGAPVTRLFAAALIPGILLMLLFMLTAMVRVKLNPSLAPKGQGATFKERIVSIKNLLPFVALIVGVLGTIFGGVMTPTEGAAMGAFLSLVLTLAYKRLTRGIIKQALLDALRVTTMGMFIFAMAITLTHALNMTGITSQFAGVIIKAGIGKAGIIVIVAVMYLLMGCLFDTWSMMFLTFPFVIPVINSLGIDVIWFGIFYAIIGEFGIVTPPFGMSLFIVRGIVPQYSLETVALGALPYIFVELGLVALMAVFPQIVLWFPDLLYR